MPTTHSSDALRDFVSEFQKAKFEGCEPFSNARVMVSFKLDVVIVAMLDRICAEFASQGKVLTRSDLMRSAVSSFTLDLANELQLQMTIGEGESNQLDLTHFMSKIQTEGDSKCS